MPTYNASTFSACVETPFLAIRTARKFIIKSNGTMDTLRVIPLSMGLLGVNFERPYKHVLIVSTIGSINCDSERLFAFGARGFAQIPLTVADGSATNDLVPIYGLYADDYLRCQVVYPAADLVDITGGTITALTFYLSITASASWGSADFHVRLADQFAESTISSFSTTTMRWTEPSPR